VKALVNARILDADTFVENAFVRFDSSIDGIGPMAEFPGADETIDVAGRVVVPGLVLAHTHAYSAFARGLALPFEPRSFHDILTQLWWKLDSALDLEAVRASGLSYGLDLLKCGVTTVIDHHASGIIRGSLDALSGAITGTIGLRGIYCFETSDRFDVDTCIAENLDFAARSGADGSPPGMKAGLLGLHASMSLSDETLRLASAAPGNLPVHIHVAESAEDEIDSLSRHGKRCVERLAGFGLLRPHSILAHCVHIDRNEAELIAGNGAYVALNPLSNMNNAVGLPDFRLLRKHAIPCVAGNDGLGSNFGRDLSSLGCAMRLSGKSPTAFGLEDLKAVLDSGYDLAGSILGSNTESLRLGRIAPGYAADLVTLNYDPPTAMDPSNAFAHYLYGMLDDFRPVDVIVNGDIRLRGGKPAVDEGEIRAEAREASAAVRRRLDVQPAYK
jgi:cytosine/adenosine deaminase-related metal-dependent hydrolase